MRIEFRVSSYRILALDVAISDAVAMFLEVAVEWKDEWKDATDHLYDRMMNPCQQEDQTVEAKNRNAVVVFCLSRYSLPLQLASRTSHSSRIRPLLFIVLFASPHHRGSNTAKFPFPK